MEHDIEELPEVKATKAHRQQIMLEAIRGDEYLAQALNNGDAQRINRVVGQLLHEETLGDGQLLSAREVVQEVKQRLTERVSGEVVATGGQTR